MYVYMIDLSFKLNIMLELKKINASLTLEWYKLFECVKVNKQIY